MPGAELEHVFADISLLIEYCAPYFDDYSYSNTVVERYDSNGGEFIISDGTFDELNHKINNRKRLWDYLIRESTEYISDDSRSVADFKSDVLNYTSLEQDLEFGFNDEYLPDIQALRSIVDQDGLNEFRNMIDDYRATSKVQRKELERNKNFITFSRRSSNTPWDIKLPLTDIVDSSTQLEALLDYAYWIRSNSGIFLIGSMSDISQKESKTENILEEITNGDVNIYSSKDVCENVLSA